MVVLATASGQSGFSLAYWTGMT
eukprot:COSAG01_NODE_73613_length_241_cov_1.774648_1_plen_22_part_01